MFAFHALPLLRFIHTAGFIFMIWVTSNYTPRLISSFSQLHCLRFVTCPLICSIQVNSFIFVNRVTGVVFLASTFPLHHLHCFTYSSPRFTVTSFVFVNCVTGIAFLASPISIIPSSLTYSRTRFIQVLRFIFAACIAVTFLVSFPTLLHCSHLLPSIRRLRYSLLISP